MRLAFFNIRPQPFLTESHGARVEFQVVLHSIYSRIKTLVLWPSLSHLAGVRAIGLGHNQLSWNAGVMEYWSIGFEDSRTTFVGWVMA